jgi:PAS domain S-box-containing protein
MLMTNQENSYVADDNHRQEKSEGVNYRFLLPIASIGLIVCFGLFWIMQLFGQWYVHTQLSSNITMLMTPLQDMVQRQLQTLSNIQELLKNEGATPSAAAEELVLRHGAETAYLSLFLLRGNTVSIPPSTDKTSNWPNTREGWEALVTSGEKINDRLYVIKPAESTASQRFILFSSESLGPAPQVFSDKQTFAVLDITALLNRMKLVMEAASVSELVLLAPAREIPLGKLSTGLIQETRFIPVIKGQVGLHMQDTDFPLRFSAAPEKFTLWVIVLPYIALVIGLLLTFLVVHNLWSAQARGVEVNSLAQSLTKTVSELEQRIVEGELMAAALRESERKYRTIFENASIGICQISPRNEWINANRTLALLLGYRDVIELLAAQPDFHNELFVDINARKRLLEETQSLGAVKDFEAALRCKDKGIIWVAINSHVVRSENGHLLHFEATFNDITLRRHSERALIAAKEQADYASRSKSEFLANMSHELRTPLNAIIGFSEIIKDELFGKVGNAQYVEYAKDIYDSGELLLSLINDILDMSKIEAGKRELSESLINVGRTIQACLRLVAARAKMSKQNLIVKIPRDFPDLRGEERAFKQILVNIMTNAIKFTPEGGNITIDGAILPDRSVQIMVMDTGIGIAPEHIPVVLAPFGQIESSLSRKNQGTGLGLPLTKALVELHGGQMEIQSELGKGTSVILTFPPERILQQVL